MGFWDCGPPTLTTIYIIIDWISDGHWPSMAMWHMLHGRVLLGPNFLDTWNSGAGWLVCTCLLLRQLSASLKQCVTRSKSNLIIALQIVVVFAHSTPIRSNLLESDFKFGCPVKKKKMTLVNLRIKHGLMENSRTDDFPLKTFFLIGDYPYQIPQNPTIFPSFSHQFPPFLGLNCC